MYEIKQIAEAIQNEGVQFNSPLHRIQHLVIDSRKMVFPSSSIFLAFPGSRKDGHEYIEQCYKMGCKAFIVRQGFDNSPYPTANFIFVADMLSSLQQIATFHREQFDIPAIGITGSNAKTWVKEWLFSILQSNFHIVRSPGSFNSQIGLALSLWNISPNHELGIFEAGISKTGEMKELQKMLHPQIGIFTHLGGAHAAGFVDENEKLSEKLHLFEDCETIIFPMDEPAVSNKIRNRYPDSKLLSWGRSPESTLCIETTSDGKETLVDCRYDDKQFGYILPFTDEISVQNSATCCLTALHLGLSPESIKKQMLVLQPMEMRLQILEARGQSTLINDAYSLDISSLEVAMDKMNVMAVGRKRTIIISDLMDQSEAAYTSLVQLINGKGTERLICVGKEISRWTSNLKDTIEIYHFIDQPACLEFLQTLPFDNEVILLKGARKFNFEQIAEFLTSKDHTVKLKIDFDAMLHNLRYFGQQVRSGVKMMAVIKAAAYGTGSLEIARFLEFFKFDYLAVAVIDEGVDLRLSGIQLPILVLNPDSHSMNALIEHDLEPEVYGFRILDQVVETAKDHKRKINIHLKLNSGMNRLGFDVDQMEKLAQFLLENKSHLRVSSIFSHLSSSDDANQEAFTQMQVSVFEDMYLKLTATLGYRPDRHILNSAGILKYPQYAFEMVRLGIGMYGVGMGSENRNLRPVHTMSARILQVRDVEVGASVGYGRAFEATERMKIATINIGYADGLPRNLGNGRINVRIHNALAPIVGNVCMDMIMCDVTDIPSTAEGDDVVIFDQYLTLDAMSEAAGTIPYEILSGISPRVKRVFHYA